MREYVEALFVRYRTQGVLVDTNLLVLLVVGLLDPRRVASFKRTAAYDADDSHLLVRAVDYFEAAVTTPHILTETSNLLGQLPGALAGQGRAILGRAVLPLLQEKSLPAADLVKRDLFEAFGLTDTAISDVSADAHLVFTDDLPLYHYLTGRGYGAITFEQLRRATW